MVDQDRDQEWGGHRDRDQDPDLDRCGRNFRESLKKPQRTIYCPLNFC